ncbi:Two component transcriptional regulator, winged helix family [Sphingobium herbicidovorans NBRC 16415]|uniref:Two component transcriptional regulator, winged helix family n=1 Tax=Sphingobium herbicidovorans (strain ATCC 700291 / DSM 11019 / CCUG 56400 / KCTC 2939 / LMG 18315 / NBRC 16415 / MH) TaxID=1219045 RepID=A0A086P6C3_SPHHM|nr:response regulator transcription factor [Sphingobium herbicidovorans]KFG88941.1 Two component transcriptional regulator, winged helix family [Sphingobium herbicidovorans NBRC 16415]
MPEHPNSRQPRLIVVDDDPDIRDLIVRQLRQDHYEVLSAGGVSEFKAALVEQRIDLIVLDLNLPDGDGLELCRELRGQGNDVRIIMVSARGSAIDRVLGLELGADDYLTKPFEPRELLVRVRNLLRRAQPDDAERQRNKGARVACFGPWRLDLFQRRLIAQDNRLVMLSSAEFRLLSRFIEEPNVVLSRENLVPERRVTAAFDRSIDLQVSRLRQKLAGAPGGEELILTVRGEGYVLATPVSYE